MYGILDNNLQTAIIYLGITEIVVVAYCAIMQQFQFMLLMGFFLLSMIESLNFYGEVNSMTIDENFTDFFLYTGVSHLAFGMLTMMKNAQQQRIAAEKAEKNAANEPH
jgi:uncharacterized membrane protein